MNTRIFIMNYFSKLAFAITYYLIFRGPQELGVPRSGLTRPIHKNYTALRSYN